MFFSRCYCQWKNQPSLERPDPALTIQFLREAGRMWAGDLAADDQRASPLGGDHSDLHATLVGTGMRDLLDAGAKRLPDNGQQCAHS